MWEKRFFFIPFRHSPTMLVNGKKFEGIFEYEVSDETLRLFTGNPYISCITQFRPIDDSPFARMVYKLLLALHSYGLYCFVTGAYALLVGGRIDVFGEIIIFIALIDTPILAWLIQKFEYTPAPHFAIDHDFTFHLLSRDDADMDLFQYHVSYEETTLQVSVMGIDTTEHCGPYSNIDLV